MSDSFLQKNRPTLTAMLKSGTTEGILSEIEAMLGQGTDAFGFQIEQMKPEERRAENYKKIFSAMRGKPAYVTNYIRGNSVPHTDEELTEELYVAVECGAKLIDVRCDLFDRQPDEYTFNETAIARQKKIIEKLHAMGAEVLMSTHIFHFVPSEEVLKIALSQQERGVDIVKIVTMANSEEELMDNLKTTVTLKEKLSVPSLFLCNGTHCKKHRILGPVLGSDMFLAVENSRTEDNQPTLKRAKEILTLTGYTDLPKGEL
ncbi:MAG: type I 3-dehydroquinate dehydratase [Acutalibacteraceae bacterium]|nr:type I 3-dehydroquinate dehydratase [Acutalibacteraceae bacterium]